MNVKPLLRSWRGKLMNIKLLLRDWRGELITVKLLLRSWCGKLMSVKLTFTKLTRRINGHKTLFTKLARRINERRTTFHSVIPPKRWGELDFLGVNFWGELCNFRFYGGTSAYGGTNMHQPSRGDVRQVLQYFLFHHLICTLCEYSSICLHYLLII